MADEHILRVEFQGDDADSQSRNDVHDQPGTGGEGRQRPTDPGAEAHKEANERADDQRAKEYGTGRSDSAVENAIESGSDEPLAGAAAGTATSSAANAAGVTAPGAAAGAAAAAGGGGGFGGGGIAAVGTGGAAMGAGTAGAGAAAMSALPIIGEVVLGIVGFGVAVVAATSALNGLFNSLIGDFEQLDPVLAQARAEQEAELTMHKMEVAPEGGAAVIEEQTKFYEEIIDIKAHLIEVMGPALIGSLKLATSFLKAFDFLLELVKNIEYYLILFYEEALSLAEHVPLIGRWATPLRQAADKLLMALDEDEDPHNPKTAFQEECENFLNGRADSGLDRSHTHKPHRQMPTTRGFDKIKHKKRTP